MTEMSLSRRLITKTKRELFSIRALGRFGLLYVFVDIVLYTTVFGYLSNGRAGSVVQAALWTLAITLACRLNYLFAFLADELAGQTETAIFHYRAWIGIAVFTTLGIALSHQMPNHVPYCGRIAVAFTNIVIAFILERIFRPPTSSNSKANLRQSPSVRLSSE
ncbi:MAG: hypothetical protein JSS86_15305 [Cyanobacteria bacterium SZAS LIN-2]|nr:hypothetical protein [Cyanobacteria bacterium SZAS LIN-2]